jgi:hypothetical protein
MNFNFGEVLTRSWQIIWKHKMLWIFGILAGCGRGGSGGNSGGGNTGFQGDGSNTELPPQVLQWFQTIEDNLTTILIIGVALLCLIWIVSIFLSTIGKIGLIRGTFQADGGAESLIFGQLFSESIPYFWRIFGLSLILGLPVFIIGMAIAVIVVRGLIASGGDESAIFAVMGMIPVMIACFCLLIPVMFVVGMIFRQAENAVVLEDMGILPAITRGWEVFKGNLGPIIIMAIILAVIGLVAGFVIAIPFFIIVFPAMLAFFAGGGDSTTPLILMGVCTCLFLPVALILQGIITAYTESAWTLTYMRLTKPPQANAPVALEANA